MVFEPHVNPSHPKRSMEYHSPQTGIRSLDVLNPIHPAIRIDEAQHPSVSCGLFEDLGSSASFQIGLEAEKLKG